MLLLWRDVWRVSQVLPLEHLLTAHHWHLLQPLPSVMIPISCKCQVISCKFQVNEFPAYITTNTCISANSIYVYYNIRVASYRTYQNIQLHQRVVAFLSSTINSFPEALNRIFCPVRSAKKAKTADTKSGPVLSWCCHRPRGTWQWHPGSCHRNYQRPRALASHDATRVFQILWMNAIKTAVVSAHIRFVANQGFHAFVHALLRFLAAAHTQWCLMIHVRQLCSRDQNPNSEISFYKFAIRFRGFPRNICIYIYIHTIYFYIVRIISATHVCKAPKKTRMLPNRYTLTWSEQLLMISGTPWPVFAEQNKALLQSMPTWRQQQFRRMLHGKKPRKMRGGKHSACFEHPGWKVIHSYTLNWLGVKLLMIQWYDEIVNLSQNSWINAPPGDPNIFISTCQSLDFGNLAG